MPLYDHPEQKAGDTAVNHGFDEVRTLLIAITTPQSCHLLGAIAYDEIRQHEPNFYVSRVTTTNIDFHTLIS